jgi:hypothetical protein
MVDPIPEDETEARVWCRVEALLVPVAVALDCAFLVEFVRGNFRLVVALLILQQFGKFDRLGLQSFGIPVDDRLIEVGQRFVHRCLSPVVRQNFPSVVHQVAINAFGFVVRRRPSQSRQSKPAQARRRRSGGQDHRRRNTHQTIYKPNTLRRRHLCPMLMSRTRTWRRRAVQKPASVRVRIKPV